MLARPFRIRRITPSRILPLMDAQTDILERGLRHAALAVMDASALGDLHLGPKRIGRSLAGRISGRLRQVEVIVRRILFLMALRLAYVPAPKRQAAPVPEPAPAPATALPDGVELAAFPRVAAPRLALLPRKQAFGGEGGFPDPQQSRLRPGGPVSPARLIARIAALRRVFKDPAGHATRLARQLHRLKAAGEPRPLVGPAGGAYRLSSELGALATLLPSQIHAALESWDTSP